MVLPGAATGSAEVKNSMRGALGLGGGVLVGSSPLGVRVAPNNGVGEGPPVGGAGGGVSVGGILASAVVVGLAVAEGVTVGRSVGMTGVTVAAQPPTNRAAIPATVRTKARFNRCWLVLIRYTGITITTRSIPLLWRKIRKVQVAKSAAAVRKPGCQRVPAPSPQTPPLFPKSGTFPAQCAGNSGCRSL
jgi:hypothetical protein